MRRVRPASRRRSRGQATVEFALVSIPLFLVVFGIIDFGILFETRLSLDSGTRASARFGAVQAGALSNANPAPANTIQGRLQATAGTSRIVNDDSHIVVSYYVPGAGSPTLCGKYIASSNTITYYSGYNRTTCLAVDNLIQVKVTDAYKFNTPIIGQVFSAGVPITTTAMALIEQPG
jgi:Flp pilus assembly protein TadG